jgi:hypothetical protein
MYKTLTEEEQLLKKVQEISKLIDNVSSISNLIHSKKQESVLNSTKIMYNSYIDNLNTVNNELSDYYDLLMQKRLDILNSKNK